METNNSKNQYFKSPISCQEGGFLYSVIIISVLFVSIVYSAIITLVFKGDILSNANLILILNYLSGPIAVSFAIGFLRFKLKKSLIKPLFNQKIKVKTIISALLICFGLLFGLSEVNTYFVLMLKSWGLRVSTPTLPKFSATNLVLIIVIVCILPAILEEIAFRGIILNGLNSTGNVFAVLISGALFSLFHMSPAQTVYQFIVGVVYALITLKGGNVIYTVFLHFINNLFVVLNYYFFNLTFSGEVKIIMIIIALVSLAVGVTLLLLDKQPSKTYEKKELLENKKVFLFGSAIGLVGAILTWIVGLL